ncbi:MAG: hypothetical protein AABX08_02170, partial [Nanoarchaeota archaeon]
WKVFSITILVFLGIISAVLIAFYVSRECNTNLDCGEGRYCAYNHKCYDFPADNARYVNVLPAALVIGIAIVIGAYILKGKEIGFRK